MKTWQYIIFLTIVIFLFNNALEPKIKLFGESSQEVYSVLVLIVLVAGCIYRFMKSTNSSK